MTWELASGRGRLVSFTVVHRPHHPAFYSDVPILFGAVSLEEGPTMLSELRVPAEVDLQIGMPMRVEFEEIDHDLVLPVWHPS
jgi:uncharacterized protein